MSEQYTEFEFTQLNKKNYCFINEYKKRGAGLRRCEEKNLKISFLTPT